MTRAPGTDAAGAVAVLRARGVTKRYARGPEVVHALDGVDLTLRRGELVAVTGPSGSGKTSLVHVLVGWERPDGGEVRWAFDDEGSWRHLAVLPQRLGLIEEVSVAENVALPLRLSPSARGAAVDELLDELGLVEVAERLPSEVSLGEQQRTALARALVLDPLVLLADEPTGHQDEAWARRLVAVLRRRCHAGGAVLVASHDPLVHDGADQVVTLVDGRVAPAR